MVSHGRSRMWSNWVNVAKQPWGGQVVKVGFTLGGEGKRQPAAHDMRRPKCGWPEGSVCCDLGTMIAVVAQKPNKQGTRISMMK